MKIEMVGLSDVGKVRKSNEDNFGVFPHLNMALVCDGMGGHNAGATASHYAVAMLKSIFENSDDGIYEKMAQDVKLVYRHQVARVVCGLRLANRYIYNTAKKKVELRGMGTTAAVIHFDVDRAILAHIGDSRIYRIRDRELALLTEDHSWINELIQDKEIKEEDARFFKKKNVITRALGMSPGLKVDLRIESVKEGDLFLLCSDGLTNSLNDDLLQAILVNYQNDLSQTATQLIKMANQVDGSDNITVVLVKVVDVGNHSTLSEPVQMLLNEEIEQISALENKYLKDQTDSPGTSRKLFKLFFLNKYIFFLIILLGTLLAFLLIFNK